MTDRLTFKTANKCIKFRNILYEMIFEHDPRGDDLYITRILVTLYMTCILLELLESIIYD